MSTLRALLFLLVFFSACSSDQDEDKEALVSYRMLSYPQDDLNKYPYVIEYLKKHPVYVSLTTSPKRLPMILPALRTINLEHVQGILLTLPKKFSRDNSEYVIPQYIRDFPKLKILRIEKDLGPITKLLPAIVYANATEHNKSLINVWVDGEEDDTTFPVPDSKAIVITVDDDTAYSPGTIGELLKVAIAKKMVAGGSGQDLSYWNIHTPSSKNECGKTQPSRCDIIEGFGAVAYPVKKVDVGMMLDFSKIRGTNKTCFKSDDLVISYALAQKGVERWFVQNPYISLQQLPYGFEEDALHRGGESGNKNEHVHESNYKKCHSTLEQLTALPNSQVPETLP